MEAIARTLMRPFAKLFPTVGTITTEKLAKALIKVSLKKQESATSVELLENSDIHKAVD